MDNLTAPAVLYVDDDLLVIDKPAGMVSTRGGYSTGSTSVQSALESKYGRLWLVHRLDKETSGVMILARNAPAHRNLNLAFDRREPRKQYLGLILDVPSWREFHADQPLKVDADRAHRTRTSSVGKPALTDFRVIDSNKDISLIEAILHTGLTHQIRAHLAGMGYPILMDTLYANREQLARMTDFLTDISAISILHRCALHAFEVRFAHPHNGKEMILRAPIPTDILEVIKAGNLNYPNG
jgi:RluA family pseudouridine synthase